MVDGSCEEQAALPSGVFGAPRRGHMIVASKKKSSIREIRVEENLRTRVESSLAAAIISGELEQGELITVPVLAVQFAVSATPVREAMLDLEKRGFVESVKNKGFRVTTVSTRDLQEIVEIRTWLEAPAMRIVARRLKGAPMENFRTLVDRIVANADQIDFKGYLEADTAFHMALLELTDNRRLVDIVSELRKQTRMVGLSALRNTEVLHKSALEHHELLDLLGAGDGAAAEKLMVRHIGHVIGWWAGIAEGDASE